MWSGLRSSTWGRTPGASWCSDTSPERPGGASSTRSARRSASAPGWATTGVLRPEPRGPRAAHRRRVLGVLPGDRGRARWWRWPPARSAMPRNGGELLDDDPPHHRPRGARDQRRARRPATAGSPMANSTTIEDGFGIDIGGGSIQGLRIEGRRLADVESLPLGAVRVSERFLPGGEGELQADEGAARPRGRRARAARLVERRRAHRAASAARSATSRPPAMKRSTLPDIDVQGFRAHARGARRADRGAGRPARLEARPGEGHQVRPRRRDPRRRARARRGHGGRAASTRSR